MMEMGSGTPKLRVETREVNQLLEARPGMQDSPLPLGNGLRTGSAPSLTPNL